MCAIYDIASVCLRISVAVVTSKAELAARELEAQDMGGMRV